MLRALMLTVDVPPGAHGTTVVMRRTLRGEVAA
jgi:hypothetical protein